MASPHLLFWNYKTPQDNAWHPLPRKSKKNENEHVLQRIDANAAIPDVACVVASVGLLAHLSQLNSFGWTAQASPLRNPKTLLAMNRAAVVGIAGTLACQAAGIEYRYLIPRWASDLERTRDDIEVRKHITFGVCCGFAVSGIWSVMRWKPRITLIGPVMGGALADLILREYYKAHGRGPQE